MSDHCASLLIRSCCSLERHGSSTIVNAAGRRRDRGVRRPAVERGPSTLRVSVHPEDASDHILRP